MSNLPNELPTHTYLHLSNEKFREISYDAINYSITIRSGRLNDQGEEDRNSIDEFIVTQDTQVQAEVFVRDLISQSTMDEGYEHSSKKPTPTERRPVGNCLVKEETIVGEKPQEDHKESSEENEDEEGREILTKKVHKEDLQRPINLYSPSFNSPFAETMDESMNLSIRDEQLSQPDLNRDLEDSAAPSSISQFRHGHYLFKKSEEGVIDFIHIQMINKYMKIKVGNSNRSTSLDYKEFRDHKTATAFLDQLLRKKLNEGFLTRKGPTSWKFDESEFAFCEYDHYKISTRRTNQELQNAMDSNDTQEIISEKEQLIQRQKKEPTNSFRKPKPKPKMSSENINKVKEAAALTIPIEYTNQNVDGWYLTEKAGGVKCLWNGSSLISKTGRDLRAPVFFIKDFPENSLDGELSAGDQNLYEVERMLRKKVADDEDWKQVKFIVFDAPEINLPFSKRLDKLKEISEEYTSCYLKFSNYNLSENRVDTLKAITKVQKSGGSGILLKDPKGLYTSGKACNVVETISVRKDEAEVVGYDPSNYEPGGNLKRLKLKMASGAEFYIRVKDSLKKIEIECGSKIEYTSKSYNEAGVPTNPVLVNIIPKTH